MKLQKYQRSFVFRDKDVVYSFWSNLDGKQAPDVIIFLGAGQTGAVIRMVARQAGSGVVVVGGVPHWHTDADNQTVQAFSKQYIMEAYRAVLETFHQNKMHLIAESQAAPATVMLAAQPQIAVGKVVLIRPLGFSTEFFGSTEQERVRTLRKRVLKTYLQFPQTFLHDPRNLFIMLVVFRAMLRERSLKTLNKKYAIGVSYDLLQDFRQMVQRQAGPVSILLGEQDKLFPPKEILAALKDFPASDVAITVIPSTTHSSLVVRDSRITLNLALSKARALKAYAKI